MELLLPNGQKPINMDVTDAKTNLLDSFIYAADDESQDEKVIPGMNSDILGYIFDKYDAIVIESFGVGGLPKMKYTQFKEMYYTMVNHDILFTRK